MAPTLNPTPVRVLRSRMAVPSLRGSGRDLVPFDSSPGAGTRPSSSADIPAARATGTCKSWGLPPPGVSLQPHPSCLAASPSSRTPPDVVLPLRLHGAGRQPDNTRPREHGGTLKVGQTALTARARELRAHRPAPLASSVSLNLVSAETASSLAPPTSCCQFWSRLSASGSSSASDGFTVLALRVAMGKSDFLSPKAIANRIKSKGLQKLRWYCQMCQKQCRDEVSGSGWPRSLPQPGALGLFSHCPTRRPPAPREMIPDKHSLIT